MENEISQDLLQSELTNRWGEAEDLLKDQDKMERFLQRLEKKMKSFPLVGSKLSYIPIMISLVKNFVKKEYTDIPIGSILAIVSALLYFVSPIDIIPDSIPFLGYIDDAAVIAVCWNLVESDVEEYVKWREIYNKAIEI